MAQYGVWDEEQDKFITNQPLTTQGAEEALRYWRGEYLADEENGDVLSVKELDHE